MSPTIVYFSNYSGNTKRFVEKLELKSIRIPISDPDDPIIVQDRYVLFVPTYGGGSDTHAIPKQVRSFLNVESNRQRLVAVVGLGNTNFGEDFCKAAEMIADKTGVPILGRVEIFGTEEDVNTIKERLAMLDDK
jgi:protein involved in ribonucleotide reduction